MSWYFNSNNEDYDPAKFAPFDPVELVKIIGQALDELGFERTYSRLTSDTMIAYETLFGSNFEKHILAGEWNEAIELLPRILGNLEADGQVVALQIHRQQFLELLAGGQVQEALDLLREKIAPNLNNQEQIEQYTRLLLCEDATVMCKKADWAFGQESRKALIQTVTEYTNPHTLLPKGRLLHLLSQAIEYQRDQCDFHSDSDSPGPISLLRDHCCHDGCALGSRKMAFNMQDMIATMHGSVNQVCFLGDGSGVVIGCEDGSLEVHDLSTQQCTTIASESSSAIRFMALGAEGQLFTISEIGAVASWHTTGQELNKYTLRPAYQGEGIAPRALAYAHLQGPVDASLVIYAEENGQVTLYDQRFAGVAETYDWMVRDLVAESNSSGFCYVAKSNGVIEKCHFSADEYQCTVVWRAKIEGEITSLSLSGSCKVLAVNTQKSIFLLSTHKGVLKRILSFEGKSRKASVIPSCFLGPNGAFLASGTLDGKILVYNCRTGALVETLEGHTGAVNGLSWSPRAQLLASGSDDGRCCFWKLQLSGH